MQSAEALVGKDRIAATHKNDEFCSELVCRSRRDPPR